MLTMCQIVSKNQAFLSKFSSKEVKLAIYGCKYTKRRLLNSLIYISNSDPLFKISQTTIGRWLGIGRQQANKLISELEQLGVLARKQIGYSSKDGWAPCIYTLSQHLYDPLFRHVMSNLLPALGSLYIAALLPGVHKNATLLKNKDLFNSMYVCMSSSFSLNNGMYEYANDIHIPKTSSKKEGEGDQTKHTQKNNQKNNGKHMIDPFPMVLDELPELNLTQAGKIKLCAFPEHILQQAKAAFKNFHKGKGGDFFPWFYKTCKRLCEESGIEPDKGKVKFLQSHFNINWFDDDFVKRSSEVNAKTYSAPQVPKNNNHSTASKFDTQEGVTRPGSVPFKRNEYEEKAMARLAQRRHDKYGPGKDWRAYEAKEKEEYARKMEELYDATIKRHEASPEAQRVRARSLAKGLHRNFEEWHKMFPIPEFILERERQQDQKRTGEFKSVAQVAKDILPQQLKPAPPPLETHINEKNAAPLGQYLQESSKNFTDDEWKYIVQRVNSFGYQFVPDHIKQWWKEQKNE